MSYLKKAKAMVLEEYGQPDVMREIDVPELMDGDILVKVKLAGICGTDVHQQIGDLSIKPPTPMIQGHETLGEIVELKGVTKDVTGTPVKEGDRILWAHQFCGECYACKIFSSHMHVLEARDTDSHLLPCSVAALRNMSLLQKERTLYVFRIR